MSAPHQPSSISEARLIANRANAQFSTGPITETGKAVVANNATKHGLTGKFKVLQSESQAVFDQLLQDLLKSESPIGADEVQMVHQMAESLWLSRRCVRMQNNCFLALECGTDEQQRSAEKSLTIYIRYQAAQDRTFSRYLVEMRKRRAERARTQRGFVSQKLKECADKRRQEAHDTRQALNNLKQEGIQVRNRLAAARAEALELTNLAKKTAAKAAGTQC